MKKYNLKNLHHEVKRGVNDLNFGSLLCEWDFKRRGHNRYRVYEMVQSEI